MRNWHLYNGMLYRNGRIVNESLLIVDGIITAFGVKADQASLALGQRVKSFDAEGCLISRGFIDLHTHLREPGFEEKETIETGSRAAARGGFTSIYAMPNTEPALDSILQLEAFLKLTEKARVKTYPVATLSKQRKGQEPVDYKALTDAGVRLFSDDGDPATDQIALESMNHLASLGGVFINHLEDKSMTNGSFFHEDIPAESEYLMLKRDIGLVKKTGCSYHAAHLSCAQSVRIIAEAKAQGLPVTAEVTPHHLLLNCDDIKEPLGNYQMKPPLRTRADQEALIEGLLDGTIDCIATDHAPHGREKEGAFGPNSPFGITGLETAFAALYTSLVLTNRLPLERLLEALTVGPASICRENDQIEIGVSADITIVDLNKRDKIGKKDFYSKGTNTPFADKEYIGWPVLTLVGGEESFNATN
ncbi:MAG: dihydroorotase [Bacillota bacterium]|jgi:dihydroorotase|nr:dihydroorotase [Bacillota bacterium]